MPDKGQASVVVDLGKRGGRVTFRSLDELDAWLAQERQAWDWLTKPATQNANSVWSQLNNRWSQIARLVTQARQDGERGFERHVPQIQSQLEQFFGQEGFVHSISPRGKFILKLAETDPAVAGSALAAYAQPLRLDTSDSSFLRGGFEAWAFEKGLPRAAEAAREAMEQLYNEAQNRLADYESAQTSLLSKSEQIQSQVADLLRQAEQEHQEALRSHAQQFEKALEDATGELHNLEITYSQKLALRAPVRYWRTKRKGHRAAAQRFAWAFSVVLLTVFAGLVGFLVFTGGFRGLEFESIGVLVVLATPALWGLRILARNLLSHIHLATDAAERETMIQTYLALLREGEASEGERQFLLQSLFRPTSTGIVRDDAAPPSWWETITRSGER